MLKTLKRWIDESKHIVFFGGAGVSTESGIPDFRSADGLYNQEHDFPPEKILSRSFFEEHPSEFFRFYRENMMPMGYEPNITHRKLAQLEKDGKLRAIITQNIDGLHQAAGSVQVLELHGSMQKNDCQICGKRYPAEFVYNSKDIPRCTCGGLIKPKIVLYEERLDDNVLFNAMAAVSDADLLIVGGTSLSVYPAAGLLSYYKGSRLVLINRDATPYDDQADLVFRCSLGDVFSQL